MEKIRKKNNVENLLKKHVEDVNVVNIKRLITPEQLKKEIPVSNQILSFVETERQKIVDILNGVDNRKLIIVGPCSIHDVEAAREYGLYIKNA